MRATLIVPKKSPVTMEAKTAILQKLQQNKKELGYQITTTRHAIKQLAEKQAVQKRQRHEYDVLIRSLTK